MKKEESSNDSKLYVSLMDSNTTEQESVSEKLPEEIEENENENLEDLIQRKKSNLDIVS
jgi:hypothetical protein